MSLSSAIDDLLALVKAHLDTPRRQRPQFDVSRFEALDRAVYLEAVSLGLSNHLPRPSFVGTTKPHGKTNMPSGPGTMHDPPGYFFPMPSQIPNWRSEMLTLRDLAEMETAKDKPPAKSEQSQPTHSLDYTSVDWYGTKYQFANGLQAKSVRVLWEAWANGTPTLSEKTIAEKIGSLNDRFRLAHVFKPRNKNTDKRESHPAWGTMIQSAGKGLFKLAAP